VKILFRTVAGPAIGLGHLMRCMTLATGLQARGHRCEFLIDEESQSLVMAIADRFGTCSSEAVIPSDGGTSDPDGPPLFDWIVVDDYTLDVNWESKMRDVAARILVIDDFADRPHDCDILLDQVAFRTERDYAGLVSKATKLLVGPRYVLLRPRFAELRQLMTPRLSGSAPRTLYVSMGGTDPHGRIAGVLGAVDRLPVEQAMRVQIVVSSATGQLGPLQAAASVMRSEWRLHVDESDVAELMAGSDLAVSAGGMTSYELACLGIPALIIPATEIEAAVAEELARWSDIVVIRGPYDDLEDAVREGLEGLLATVADGADLLGPAEHLDGRGLERVLDAMESYAQGE